MKISIFIGLFLVLMSPKNLAADDLGIEKPLSMANAQSKIEKLLLKNPDWNAKKIEFDLSELKKNIDTSYFIPDLSFFSYSEQTQMNSKWSPVQSGFKSDWNLFKSGSDFYLAKSAMATAESEKIRIQQELVTIENSVIKELLNYHLATQQFNIHKSIVDIKLSTLNVAKQRFDQGHLPQSQLDKIEIDYINATSARDTIETEILSRSVEIKKLGAELLSWFLESDFKVRQQTSNTRLWPELQKLDLERNAKQDRYTAAKLEYFPRLDLSARAYQTFENDLQNPSWDLSLTLTWKIWDNWDRANRLKARYQEFIFSDLKWAQIQQVENQLYSNRQSQLNLTKNQIMTLKKGLRKLEGFYKVSEKAFSQGRITVNELFQDQQLLLETQYNFQTQLFKFHSLVLDICAEQGLRIWDCVE